MSLLLSKRAHAHPCNTLAQRRPTLLRYEGYSDDRFATQSCVRMRRVHNVELFITCVASN
eukprot:14960417-Alexandrium_andersonii.AAC.1